MPTYICIYGEIRVAPCRQGTRLMVMRRVAMVNRLSPMPPKQPALYFRARGVRAARLVVKTNLSQNWLGVVEVSRTLLYARFV